MKTTLSHSQINKYSTCPKSYEYHYIKKIRPRTHSAALVFGSAIDNALNILLTGAEGKPEVEFERSFRFTKVNNKDVYVPTYEELVYQNADFDSDLLVEDDYNHIAEQAETGVIDEHADYLEVYSQLKTQKKEKGLDSFTVKEKRLYNLMNWLCLKRKGLLMIKAYRKKVMPKLVKVHEVQKRVSLTNDKGDEIVGYVDLIADVEGYGNVVLDNKTASQEYEAGAVLTSPQLTLYMHILEEQYQTRKAGYIVMLKNVIKNKKKVCSRCDHDGSGGRHKTCANVVDGARCNGEWIETINPDIYIQFIVDDIPEQTESIVMENLDSTNEAIKNGVFTRNFNACHNHFGSLCPYFNLCYKADMKGLEDLKK